MKARRIIASVNAAALGSIATPDLAALCSLSLTCLLRARLAFLATLPPGSTAVVPTPRLIVALHSTLHEPSAAES